MSYQRCLIKDVVFTTYLMYISHTRLRDPISALSISYPSGPHKSKRVRAILVLSPKRPYLNHIIMRPPKRPYLHYMFKPDPVYI